MTTEGSGSRSGGSSRRLVPSRGASSAQQVFCLPVIAMHTNCRSVAFCVVGPVMYVVLICATAAAASAAAALRSGACPKQT